jgi:mRNA interferase MazF
VVNLERGELWWADLGDTPIGSSPGYRRPVVILQCKALNRSRLSTVIVVVVTSNLNAAQSSDNVLLEPADSGLSRQSVVTVSQVLTIDRSQLLGRISQLSFETMFSINASMRRVLEL